MGSCIVGEREKKTPKREGYKKSGRGALILYGEPGVAWENVFLCFFVFGFGLFGVVVVFCFCLVVFEVLFFCLVVFLVGVG